MAGRLTPRRSFRPARGERPPRRLPPEQRRVGCRPRNQREWRFLGEIGFCRMLERHVFVVFDLGRDRDDAAGNRRYLRLIGQGDTSLGLCSGCPCTTPGRRSARRIQTLSDGFWTCTRSRKDQSELAVTTLLRPWVCGKSSHRPSTAARGPDKLQGFPLPFRFVVSLRVHRCTPLLLPTAVNIKSSRRRDSDRSPRRRQGGDALTFDSVLLVSGRRGRQDRQAGSRRGSVAAEILKQEMGDKIYIQKMRRRNNFRRRTGHRQMYTRVRIGAITA